MASPTSPTTSVLAKPSIFDVTRNSCVSCGVLRHWQPIVAVFVLNDKLMNVGVHDLEHCLLRFDHILWYFLQVLPYLDSHG